MTAFTGRREMQVTEDDFDADPHLLNTPIGIVDLREASLHEHDSERLMRCMTAVAPDMALILQCTFGGKKWPDLIPLFWRAVENIAREPSDPDAFEKGLPLGAIRPNYIGVTSRWLGYSLSGWRWHQHLMFVQGWPGVGKTQVYEAFLMLIGDYGVVLPDTFLLKTDEGKRFDLMQIVGKRFGFFDETRMGSTFYETRASKVVGSEMLAGEIKGGRVNVPFKNVTKLSLVGNHKPHFHSGETGGLATRLLLFEAGGRGFRNKPGDQIDNLSALIVEQEGPAVLAYLINQARLDYMDKQKGSVEYARMMAPLRAAAQGYVGEDSFLRRWADARGMAAQPGLDIDLREAYDMFKAYATDQKDQTAQRFRLSDFKQAIQKAFPVTLGNRTKGSHKNRAYIDGFGHLPIDFGDAPNVVSIAEAAASDKSDRGNIEQGR